MQQLHVHRSSSIDRRRRSRELGTHVRNACARTAANLSLVGRYLSLFPSLLPGAFRANAALVLVVSMVNAATAARCQQLTVMRTTRPIVNGCSIQSPWTHLRLGNYCSSILLRRSTSIRFTKVSFYSESRRRNNSFPSQNDKGHVQFMRNCCLDFPDYP